MRRLARWLLTHPRRPVQSTRLRFEPLEDRVVPEGRPLPYPVIAVGPAADAAGVVRLFDADTGAPLLTLTPYAEGMRAGVRVAVGDLTGDGYPDVVTAPGPGSGPHVRAFDGKTGGQLPGPLGNFFAYDPSFTGGVNVAVGDVTGDGKPDLVTAADAGGGPHIRAFDGQTGGELASFFALEPEFTGGVRLAVGDLTGDDRGEIVVAAGVGGAPRVRVLDATTLQPIAGPLGDFFAFDPAGRGGVYAAASELNGDVTGDGRGDLALGAGSGSQPVVRVLDGATGSEAWSKLAFESGFTGGVPVALAFVNQDARADVVAGSGPGRAPRVRTLDGVTGELLAGPVGDFDPGVGTAAGGLSLAAGNDPPPPGQVIYTGSSTDYHGAHVDLTVTLTGDGKYSWDYLVTNDSFWGGTEISYFEVSFSGPNPVGVTDAANNLIWSDPPDGAWDTVAWSMIPGEPSQLIAPGGGTGEFSFKTSPREIIAAHISLDDSGGYTFVGPGEPITSPPVVPTPPNLAPQKCPEPIIEPAPAAGGANATPNATPNPVRYTDGVAVVYASDLGSGGMGGWGHTRSWSSDARYAAHSFGGNGWVASYQPFLTRAGSELVLVTDAVTAYHYDGQGTPDANGNYATYTPRFFDTTAVTYASTTDEFVLADREGQVFRFAGFGAARPAAQRGTLVARADAAGNLTQVVSWDGFGRPTEVRQSATVGGTTTTESYLTTYLPSGNPNAGRTWTVTLRRQVNGGSWSTVRQVTYDYYTSGETGGTVGDLRRATVADAGGAVIDQTYYRYYTGSSSTGYAGGLKYALGVEAYARLKAAAGGTDADVIAAGDSTVASHADNYFEYDSQRRVTKEVAAGAGCSACSAGQGEYTYTYTTSSNADGFNSWETKTVEALPDNTTNTVYTNAYGQVMLRVHTDAASQKWLTYYRYDGAGRVVLEANPSAVSGYNDASADLVQYVGADATHLRNTAGLVAVYNYFTATTATDTTPGGVAGYQSSTAIRQGEAGSDVPQQAWTYFRRVAGGAVATPIATDTVYRNDNGTGAQTTSYAYAWQGSTVQPYSVTTTLQTVTTAQNGPGTAATSTVVFDTYGRPIWMKDAGGFLSYAEYDAATGAVTKTIADVDTDLTADFANLPGGWSNPTGLHLKATAEVDALGRATKATDPAGHVTYTVYNDPAHEVRVYRGWDATANLPTGPTEVVRDDRASGYTEALTMSATPAVSGGRPTGAETVGSLQSLSRSYRNTSGQTTHADAYFNLSGLTYATSTSLGTEGTHFYRTRQDYDKQGRPSRTVSPSGTVYRTESDGQGRPVSEWVGTDDTPTSGSWSPANLAGTDMKLVRQYEYDGGGVGDSNLTKVTDSPVPGQTTTDRVTQAWYDWRNRPVAVKAGVQGTESTSVNRPITYAEYDNLGQVVASELYDGDAVTVTTTGGVPNRPSSSLLRAKSTAEYDEWGRAFRTKTYSVDPSSGSVSTNALTADVWFDKRGNVVKVAAPGAPVEKAVYDGVGRVVTTYVTDGGGDTGWADADDVTGDTVLTQTEVLYDANSNPIKATTRERFRFSTGTGPLGTPTTGIQSRVYYSASYYDLADRPVASVDVGTNGGTAWTRPSTVPARSDTVLVTSFLYDAAGRLKDVTDPKGLVARAEYDALGRTTKTVENYVDGTPSNADDKTTEYGYGPAGMTSLTAKLTGGGVQTTAWVYGVSPADGSAITSNDLVREVWHPNPSTGAASSGHNDVSAVNALGQPVSFADRNGTTHEYTYDALGRQTRDEVTTLGSGVISTVRRLDTAYDGQGNPYLFGSLNATATVVNQVRREFSGLGQLTDEYQAHGGAVNTSTTPEVRYTYSFQPSGTANHSRPTGIVYPDGRAVSYTYSAGINDTLSRLSSIGDAATGTLESYQYLGLGTVVVRGRPEPGHELRSVKLTGEADGEAGDPYTGLDRFGRVADQRWVDSSTGAAIDRQKHGYDRDGNRTYREDGVFASHSEAYQYDGLNQLTGFQRGTLTAAKDGVTGTPSRSQSWSLDAAGNWDAVTTDGAAQARTHNAQNEVTSIGGATTPTYDLNGNMTRDETGRLFSYDAWDRLVRVRTSGGTILAEYAYDALGRRVTDGRAMYYSADWQVLEIRSGGQTREQYVWSPVYVDALVARDRDADLNGTLEERRYAVNDANFNVTALTDAAGVVVERYGYDPYGAAAVLDANGAADADGASDHGWVNLHQGLRYDARSGLYHVRNRDYSPTLGRWVSMDPIGFSGGDANLYRYVGNAPSQLVDPYGLMVDMGLLGRVLGIDWNDGKITRHGVESGRTSGSPAALEDAIKKVKNGLLRGMDCLDIESLLETIEWSIVGRQDMAAKAKAGLLNASFADENHLRRIDLEIKLAEALKKALDDCLGSPKPSPSPQASPPNSLKLTPEEALKMAEENRERERQLRPSDNCPQQPGQQGPNGQRGDRPVIPFPLYIPREKPPAGRPPAPAPASPSPVRPGLGGVIRAVPGIIIRRATGFLNLVPEYMFPGYEGPA